MLGATMELVHGSSRPAMNGCSGVGRGSRNTTNAVACMDAPVPLIIFNADITGCKILLDGWGR